MTDQREPGAATDIAIISSGVTVVGIGAIVYAGARLSVLISGGAVGGGLSEWLVTAARLARGRGPAQAWGETATGLPTPWVYWCCTVLAAAVAAALVAGSWRVWRRLAGPRRRTRFGQPTEAREARAADIVPLVVDSIEPPTGRMLLGRVANRKTLLATEDRIRHPLDGKRARRQGNRGSVALIGPTGSGKTALAASAIATWDGPVVAVSVKRDLYDTTAFARAKRGEIAVFDPGGSTGMPTARWSPLERITSSSAALRTGRALAQAIPRGGVTNADYWAKHGEKLLGAFMAIAGLSRMLATRPEDAPVVSIEQLATWVTTMAGNDDQTINHLIRTGLHRRQPREVRLLARHAAVTFGGLAKEDHKIRSSIYATAALALDPWLEPAVAHSASQSARPHYWSDQQWEHRPAMIDLDWLMAGDGSNTLYLAASQPEFERLSPVLGGLLADLKDSVHAWDIAGRRLEKPLLIVIDEAGQLELGWLPAEVSTIAALGAFFVTCWQSLAQMQHRYGSLSDAVLSGHRTKCFFAGVDDLATTRYLSGLLGHEHVRRLTKSKDTPQLFGGGGSGRSSVSETDQSEEFAPANAVRQMYPGEAVLLHGTLPPVHLSAVRWWQERSLADLVPLDEKGNPTAPANLRTCPLTTDRPTETDDVLDERTFAAAVGSLPAIGTKPWEEPTPAGISSGNPVSSRQPVGRCDSCGDAVFEGEARRDLRGGRDVLRCIPTCTERRLGRSSA